MKLLLKKSLTLIELLVALVILSLLVIGLSSIDIFSRFHVLSADRRARSQNEATYILEHMTKQITQAIGDANHNPVQINNLPDGQITIVQIDSNGDGRLDPSDDRRIAYRYYDRSAPNYKYQVRFTPDCLGINCTQSNVWETVSLHVVSFNCMHTWTDTQRDNFMNVTIGVTWNPDNPICHPIDNPCVTMTTTIKMPAVSIH